MTAPSQDLGALRVLHVDGELVWASRGLGLLCSTDAGQRFHEVARLPGGWLARALAEQRFSGRLLRAGLQGLTPDPAGGWIAVLRGALARYTPGDPELRRVFEIPRGSRTLGVEATPGGKLYFGEYCLNPERHEVHVYGSDDGVQWEVAYTFPSGSVRHVHGVIHDPFRGGHWVTTGDFGAEAGLWFTDDDFRTLRPVARGTQRHRAVRVAPIPGGLIVPMDSASEPNRVQLYDIERDELTDLADLAGSVLYLGRAGGRVVLSTSVEPSEVNRETTVSLLACDTTGELDRWEELARTPKDLAWLGSRYTYFQYPTWQLPSGPGHPDWIFASGRALRGRDGRLMRFAQGPLATANPNLEEESSCAESLAGSTLTVA